MWAQLMAALYNGPSVKKGSKEAWTSTEFLKTPWQAPKVLPALQRERKKGAKSPTRADFAGNKVR